MRVCALVRMAHAHARVREREGVGASSFCVSACESYVCVKMCVCGCVRARSCVCARAWVCEGLFKDI